MKSQRILSIASLAVLISCLPLGASAENTEVKASDSQDLSLTIYNQDFGLVRDVRNIELHAGINYLRFEDVAAKIDPTSVNFVSLTAPNAVTVREQNYQYDLLDPNTILSKSVGKNVRFMQYLPGGQINEVSGILLNPPQTTVYDGNSGAQSQMHGLVLKTANGILLDPAGQPSWPNCHRAWSLDHLCSGSWKPPKR